MAQEKIKIPANVVERNILLVKNIMRYLLDNPQLFDSLPDDFELVVLPENDLEMRLYNLGLLDKYGREGKPVVFARIKTTGANVTVRDKPSLTLPKKAVETQKFNFSSRQGLHFDEQKLNFFRKTQVYMRQYL